MPSDHVCSKLVSPVKPHFLFQAPEGAQQLIFPDLLNVAHLGHVAVLTKTVLVEVDAGVKVGPTAVVAVVGEAVDVRKADVTGDVGDVDESDVADVAIISVSAGFVVLIAAWLHNRMPSFQV